MLNIVCDPNIRVINVIHHWLIVITQLAFFACQSDVFDWYKPGYPQVRSASREIKQPLQIFVVAYFVLSDVGCHVIIVQSSATGTIWL